MHLTLERDGNWVVLAGPAHPSLASHVRALRPSYREFDGRRWRVHVSQLPRVVDIARQLYGHVDWSHLPPAWQVVAAGGAAPGIEVASSLGDAYAALHLLPSAPPDVVKAAYRALALEAHPDRGGSVEEMQRLNDALTTINTYLS